MSAKLLRVAAAVAVLVGWQTRARAADDSVNPPDRPRIAASVERGLQILSRGARNYPSHRQCFSCHHQPLPVLAESLSRAAGLTGDAELPREILEFTTAAFRNRIDDLNAGERIGGRAMTVVYALWTMQLAAAQPDELSQAMVAYLLKTQQADGSWTPHPIRPPAAESRVTCTVLAIRGIRTFAVESQQAAATAAIEKARAWLDEAKLEFHEDRVAKLWALQLLNPDDELIRPARTDLFATQRPDGGWAQLTGLDSDPYATGIALYVLLDNVPLPLSTVPLPPFARGGQGGSAAQSPAARIQTEGANASGELPTSNVERPTSNAADADAETATAISRAADFLLNSQFPDGSWFVRSRAKPVQVFFDNDDPHGKDQFISITATGWATAALARMLAVTEFP